jgi:M6 family metalloprotease-like protein
LKQRLAERLLPAAAGGLLVMLFAAGAASEVMEIKRPEEVTRTNWTDVKNLNEERYRKWTSSPVRDMPSTRNLLRSRRHKLGEDFAMLGAVPGPDTLRIALIRVEFQSVPDASKITGGTGRFDLDDGRDSVFIDPPPHDRKYFSAHMRALSYYYDAMSYGNLKILHEVYPLSNDKAYVLPDAGKYNPSGSVNGWNWENLEDFFTDAVRAADEDPDLTFSDYDAVIIAHAGSDWQNDIYRDSPYDFPSFFISLAGSVAVDDSTYFIVDGSVVPETGSQDGYYNGINGVVAHETGHQLGLPDLYDTYIGGSVVGYWDLMDFGSGVGIVLADPATDEAYYVTGIVPGPLSIWSRTFLGWLEPDTVYAGGRFSLDAIDLQGGFPGKEGLIVPMNSYEYYMIENRQCDLDGDGIGYLQRDPSADSTGVVIGPVNEAGDPNYEFSFALPGCGLLIWRVDQVMVDYGNPWDIVNAYPQRRGVRIMEADGTWDLGDYNSFYFLGSPYDPFFQGDGGSYNFTDDSYPPSRSNTGCHAHVEVTDISESMLTMDFDVGLPWAKKRFPIALGDSLRYGITSVLVADVDGDGSDEIAASSKRAAWVDTLGTVFQPADLSLVEFSAASGPRVVPGWPRRIHGSRTSEILAADLDGDGTYEILTGDNTGRLYAFSADGTPYFENADALGAFMVIPEGVNGAPVAFDMDGEPGEEVLVGTGEGIMALSGASRSGVEIADLILSPGGFSQPVVADLLQDLPGDEIVAYTPGALNVMHPLLEEVLVRFDVDSDLGAGEAVVALADIDRAEDGAYEVILSGNDGTIWVYDSSGNLLPGWGRRITSGFAAPPAIADIDGDGYLDIVVTDLGYRTYAFDKGGARVTGWPQYGQGCSLPMWDAEFYPADTTVTVAAPVLVDIDGDGVVDVVQGTRYECIVAWGGGGKRIPGYPFTLGGAGASVAFGDIDGDGKGEFVAGGGEGFLYGFTGTNEQCADCQAPWRTSYFDRSRNCVYPPELMPGEPVEGTALLVRNSFHAFPNPADLGEVTFSFDTETGGTAMVEIYDVTGLKVMATPRFEADSKTEYTVDISDLASGLYVCRLYIEGERDEVSESFKLAVKR